MEFEKVREEDVLKLLEERKFADVRDLLKDMEPIDIAELLEEMPEEKLPLLFRILPKEMAADTFVEMDSDMQEYLGYLGCKLDAEKNNVRGEERIISTDDSKVIAMVVPTNEELAIARETVALV